MASKQSTGVKNTKTIYTFAVEVRYEGDIKKPSQKQMFRWLSNVISRGETPPQTVLLKRAEHRIDVVGQNRVFFMVRGEGGK